MREIVRLIVILGMICALTAWTLTATRTTLATRIERQFDLHIRGPALERLFGRPFDDSNIRKVNLCFKENQIVVFYAVEDDGTIRNIAVESAGKGGYGGDILILLGIDMVNEKISGLEIVKHSETPGVGSNIESSTFRDQWIGLKTAKSLAFQFNGGQIDAITGATYSSNAVLDGVNRIINVLKRNRKEILAAFAGTPVPNTETIKNGGMAQ